jgi:hypothetical protein
VGLFSVGVNNVSHAGQRATSVGTRFASICFLGTPETPAMAHPESGHCRSYFTYCFKKRFKLKGNFMNLLL